MAVIFDNFESIEMTQNHLERLHSILLKYSDKDESHRGEYKTSTNSVGVFMDGKLTAIIFETASPFETPIMMQRLINWFKIVSQKD